MATPICLTLSRMFAIVELGSSNSCGGSNGLPVFRISHAAKEVKRKKVRNVRENDCVFGIFCVHFTDWDPLFLSFYQINAS